MKYVILKPEQAHPVRGVLFDMDGLVLDTERLYSRFWMEAARELGLPITWEQTLGLRSLNFDRGQAYLRKLFGFKVDYQAVRNLRIRRMDAWIEQHGVEPKPGIFDLLVYIHSHGIRCAITSSAPEARIREYLTPTGLYDQFDLICSGHNMAHGKPEPDIYLVGAAGLHLSPNECLALEDSPAGIESASRAGCMAVMIPDLDQPDSYTLSRCFARAEQLSDIRDLIERLS